MANFAYALLEVLGLVVPRTIVDVIWKHVPSSFSWVNGIIYTVSPEGILKFHKGKVRVSSSSGFFKHITSGLIIPIHIDVEWEDAEHKASIIQQVLKSVWNNGRLLIIPKPEDNPVIGFAAKSTDWDRVMGSSNWRAKRPVIKPFLPLASNNIGKLVSEDTVLRVMFVDTVPYCGVKSIDGMTFFSDEDVSFSMVSHVSAKSTRRPRTKKLGAFQFRVWPSEELPFVNKALGGACVSRKLLEETCAEYGLTLPSDVCAVSCTGNIKCGKIKHGQILDIPASKIELANFLETSGFYLGNQAQCTDLVASRKFFEEPAPWLGATKTGRMRWPGLAAQADLTANALEFKVEAMREVLAATDSHEDATRLEAMALYMAIKKNGHYRSMAFNSQWTRLAYRNSAWLQSHAEKRKAQNTGEYILPHPTLLLDKLAAQIFELHNVWVNLVMPPEPDGDKKAWLDDWYACKYQSLTRSPQEHLGCCQEVLVLQTDAKGEYILDPEVLRSKAGTPVTSGITNGMYVSWLQVWLMNGDFDGDACTTLHSNVAVYPVWRPEEKDIPLRLDGEYIPAESKFIPEVDGDDLYALMERAILVKLEAKGDIGRLDSVRKTLYGTLVKNLGKPVTIAGKFVKCSLISPYASWRVSLLCTQVIDRAKHEIGTTAKSATALISKHLMPGGKMPKVEDRPFSVRMTSQSFFEGTNVQEDFGPMCREYQKQGIPDLDIYKSLWTRIAKCSPAERDDMDSQYWQDVFEKLANQIVSQSFQNPATKESVCFVKAPWLTGERNGWVEYEVFESARKFARDLVKWYWSRTKIASQLEDAERYEEFSLIGQRLNYKLESYLWKHEAYSSADIFDWQKRQIIWGALCSSIEPEFVGNFRFDVGQFFLPKPSEGYQLIRHKNLMFIIMIEMGRMAFGVGVNQRGEQYAKNGASFSCLPANWIYEMGKYVHPDNPIFK